MIWSVCGMQAGFVGNESERVMGAEAVGLGLAGVAVQPAGHIQGDAPTVKLVGPLDPAPIGLLQWALHTDTQQGVYHPGGSKARVPVSATAHRRSAQQFLTGLLRPLAHRTLGCGAGQVYPPTRPVQMPSRDPAIRPIVARTQQKQHGPPGGMLGQHPLGCGLRRAPHQGRALLIQARLGFHGSKGFTGQQGMHGSGVSKSFGQGGSWHIPLPDSKPAGWQRAYTVAAGAVFPGFWNQSAALMVNQDMFTLTFP